jgi:hypothetical protein
VGIYRKEFSNKRLSKLFMSMNRAGKRFRLPRLGKAEWFVCLPLRDIAGLIVFWKTTPFRRALQQEQLIIAVLTPFGAIYSS